MKLNCFSARMLRLRSMLLPLLLIKFGSAMAQNAPDIKVEAVNLVLRGSEWAEVYFKLTPTADFSLVSVSCWIVDETGKPVMQGITVETNVGANSPYFGKVINRTSAFMGKLSAACRVDRVTRPTR